MFHLIWYILIGLISGVIAKSVMHVHITIFWTIVLGIIGSIIGGSVTHMFSRPTNQRYHPAGLIFSALRENSEKPPIGGDLSVCPFLGFFGCRIGPLGDEPGRRTAKPRVLLGTRSVGIGRIPEELIM